MMCPACGGSLVCQSCGHKVGMSFGAALEAMKAGACVSRAGWNGKGMWLELSAYGSHQMYKDRLLQPHILMATAQGNYVPWLASQTDLLSEDWSVSPTEEAEK